MSKDIWHSAQEIPLFDDTVVFIDDLNNWHTGYTQRDNDGITDHDSGEIYTEENVLRWAYIKDLLALETELIRTRKALEVAVDALKEYADRDNWGMGFAPWLEDGFKDALYTEDGYKTAEKALAEITALEQKD